MQYQPMGFVEDPLKKEELLGTMEEVNVTFIGYTPLLNRQLKKHLGMLSRLAYAQAIADEIFERRLPHRGYRVICKMEKTGFVEIDLEEPVGTVK